jgi:very-short-patch-repair endonuclease
MRVYRLYQETPPSDRQLLRARTLAVEGVVSGRSAGALYGWMPFPRAPEITVERSQRRNTHVGIRITDSLPAQDVGAIAGIPVTTPTRTLIDLAAVLGRDRFEGLLDQVLVSRVVSATRLETRARELRVARRPGCAVVLRLLDQRHPELTRARNAWEAKVLRTIGRLELPPPRVNYRVRVAGRTRYIDLAWPDRKIALELDGFVPHSNRRVFDDDRQRQNDLVAAGWTVYRVTWTAFTANARAALRHVVDALTE